MTVGPKKGKGLLLLAEEDPPASERSPRGESMEDDGPTEDQLDAAAALREALSGDDDAAIVDAFKAMKMACEEGY